MIRSQKLSLCGSIVFAAAVAGCGTETQGVERTAEAIAQAGPQVSPAEHHDVSPPLFLIPPAERTLRFEDHAVKRLPKLPPATGPGLAGDQVVQSVHAIPQLLAPTLGVNFDGVGVGLGSYADCCAPPDTNGDVGPNHFVETVNLDYVVFNKSGGLLLGPVAINTLWSGFGGGCQANNDGDPIVLYDPIADRWVISQFSVTTTPYLQCVAVSQTPSPTGAFFRYSFNYGNTDFVDYPKMGVWPDAYYETYNIFANGVSFSGAKVCAFDRSKMLIGAAATQQCFQLSPTWGGLLPSDMDGHTVPPAGSPNYVVGLDAPVTSTLLQYWKFHVDWTTPANTTFTGPTAITVASYTNSCNTLARGDCIPQGGGGTNLESLADRAMYRFAYRNFGDHEALVFNHTIEVGSGSSLHSGVRWYELRPDVSHNLSLFQQGTYAPDSNWRWMGSAAMDKGGNIAIGYSVSSSSISPQIHFTGRAPGDALGTMSQGENVVINGGGSQNGGLARWGDYSMMGIDPVDDCTFWYTNEYLKASGSFNWSTRINSFKLPGCGNPDFSIGVSPASQTVVQGASTTYTATVTPSGGFTGTVTFSASGLPAGASASFNPASVPGSGSSTMTVTTASTTPTGTFVITVTGTSGALVHSATTNLVVNPAPVPDYAISASPASQTVVQGSSTSYTVTITPSNGFTGTVTLAASGLPSGASASFNPATVTTSGTSTMTVTTSTSTPAATSTLTITGTSGSLSHSTTVSLVVTAAPVPNFSISASPASQTVVQGSSTSYTVTITPSNGFTGTVTLAASGLPSGASASFNPATVTTSGTSTMTVTTATTTPTGSSVLTITGTSGSLSHSTTVTLVVNAPADYSLSATPSSQTVAAGASTSYTVNITRTGGFTGGVTFSSSGLPSGATGSFSPNPSTGASSSFSVSTTTATTPGTYPVTITGTSGSLTHTTSVTLVVNPAAAGDFSLALSPTSVTAKAGTPANYTVNITRTGGFAGGITFSLAGAPAGSAVTFAPNPATGASSALTVTTPATTTGATYSLTVTGVSGALSHTAAGTLVKTAGCVNGDGDC